LFLKATATLLRLTTSSRQVSISATGLRQSQEALVLDTKVDLRKIPETTPHRERLPRGRRSAQTEAGTGHSLPLASKAETTHWKYETLPHWRSSLPRHSTLKSNTH